MTDRDRAAVAEEQLEQLPPDKTEQVEEKGALIEEAPSAGQMKIDLHCHSEASPDCSSPFEEIPERCVEAGVAVQAITDHDRIDGAERVRDHARSMEADVTIIIGEEVMTTEGEIVGLFLEKPIPPDLFPDEAVQRIQAQGGLVLLPHGFDPLKTYRLKPSARERIASSIQIVETFNARISAPRWNRAAVVWAEERGALMSAGSDAHTLADIGSAWVEVARESIEGPADLLDALKGGVPVGHWTHPVIAYVYKLWDRFWRRVRG